MSKTPSHATLKKNLWKTFSEYIRRRDADWQGYACCCTCGKTMKWNELDAGHYEPKTSGLSVYFLEYNVHPQCTGCNRFRHGNQTQYALYLRKRYGDQILEKIEWAKKQKIIIKESEYKELIKYYKDKIKELN